MISSPEKPHCSISCCPLKRSDMDHIPGLLPGLPAWPSCPAEKPFSPHPTKPWIELHPNRSNSISSSSSSSTTFFSLVQSGPKTVFPSNTCSCLSSLSWTFVPKHPCWVLAYLGKSVLVMHVAKHQDRFSRLGHKTDSSTAACGMTKRVSDITSTTH